MIELEFDKAGRIEMVRLVFVRHGSYHDQDYQDLGLTETGRKSSAAIAQKLHEREIDPDAILESPMPRTVESGTVLLEQFSKNAPVVSPVETPFLGTSFGKAFSPHVGLVLSKHPELENAKTIVCVTHGPNFVKEIKHWGIDAGKSEYWQPEYSEAMVLTFESDDWSKLGKPTIEFISP